MDPRNAVDTALPTESGSSMPFWASKCTHPSPKDGCRPRTRATSYAMPAHLKASVKPTNRHDFGGCPAVPGRAHAVPGPGHLGSHTSPVSLGFGVLAALLLLVIPGAIVARVCGVTWPAAVAVGPALTYGIVALAIVPFGPLGVRWNA